MAAEEKAAGAALVLLALAGPAARPVWAQESDAHARAVQLFDEAARAQDRRAYDEACPTFARVVELEPGKVGAKLALADCYEQAGKLGSAVAAYRAADARAAETGDPRRAFAGEKAAALEGRAPRLTILVPEALRSLPGLTVLRDGVPLDAAQWNQAVLSDSGEHAIYVAATGKKPWLGRVTVSAGGATQIVIGGLDDLPAPAVAAASPAPAPPPPIAPGVPQGRVPIWAWVTGGLGVASGGAAVASGVDQAAAQSAFDTNCKRSPRDATACGQTSARLYRDFGLWIGLGSAGIVALAAAAIGIAVPPRRRTPASLDVPVRASLWIVPEAAGAGVQGRF